MFTNPRMNFEGQGPLPAVAPLPREVSGLVCEHLARIHGLHGNDLGQSGDHPWQPHHHTDIFDFVRKKNPAKA